MPLTTPTLDEARRFLLDVVDPALRALGLLTVAARVLMVGTALAESRLVYRRQLGGGPARGLFQIEPATFRDIYGRYLVAKPGLLAACNGLLEPHAEPWAQVETNDRFACAIARCRYLMDKAPVPWDAAGQAEYHKRVYNTASGPADPAETLRWFQMARDAAVKEAA